MIRESKYRLCVAKLLGVEMQRHKPEMIIGSQDRAEYHRIAQRMHSAKELLEER